jgi:FkbM family methyltransferase
MTLPVQGQFARAFGWMLGHSPLQHWPVHIRHGNLRGWRWTLWPHSAYWRGHYEPEVQAALVRIAPPPGGTAWDLGAHFGFYSLWFAHAVGPAGQVCAFEPDPASHARLRRHVAMNGINHVRTYAKAVSRCNGTEALVQHEGKGATTSHLPYEGETTAGQQTVSVETVALDHLMRQDGLCPPQLIKIDIEGHAAAALAGAQHLLRRHRPVMLISLHSPREVAGVQAELEPLGYRPHSLAGTPTTWADTLFQTVVVQA